MTSLERSLSFCARAGLGACLLLAAAAPASAATITFSFTGTVTSVAGLGSQFAAGDAMSGTFVFDSEAIGTNCGGACKNYDSPLQALSLTIGSYTASGTVSEQLLVMPGLQDEYGIFAMGPSISGAPVNGIAPNHFYLTLTDPTATALSTKETLLTPVFGDYAERTFGLLFGNFGGVAGTITSLSEVQTPPAAVPEPTSLLLLGTGIVALAGRARRYAGMTDPSAH